MKKIDLLNFVISANEEGIITYSDEDKLLEDAVLHSGKEDEYNKMLNELEEKFVALSDFIAPVVEEYIIHLSEEGK